MYFLPFDTLIVDPAKFKLGGASSLLLFALLRWAVGAPDLQNTLLHLHIASRSRDFTGGPDRN